LADGGVCVACNDERAASAIRQIRLGEYLQRVIGPFGVTRYRLDNFSVTAGNMEAFKACEDFDHRTDNLFMYGACGTGKTHLAGTILKRACALGLNVKWVNPMYLTRLIKSRWVSDEEAILEDLVLQDVLVVDDLGTGSDLNTTLRAIYEITDKRKAQNRNGLVITSNLSLDLLAQAYRDDRISSRISGLCKMIPLIGDDQRNRGE
jgi:DNA replication protein DnaC